MYWPIGAPRVSAATKQALSRGARKVSEDLLDIKEEAGAKSVHVKGDTEYEADESADGTSIANHDGANVRGKARARAISQDTIRPSDLNGAAQRHDRDYLAVGDEILCATVARSGHLFVTITATTLSVWQAKPMVVVASLVRSAQSLKSYGPNEQVLLRPDSAVVVIQTSLSYLIMYALATDASTEIYRSSYADHGSGHARHKSLSGNAIRQGDDPHTGPGEGHGIREVSLHFKMVIKLESGISKVLALDDELIVATHKPAAIQCIRWVPDKSGNQHSTQLLKNFVWMQGESPVVDMVFDRPMNIATWITADGKAYAVQRTKARRKSDGGTGQRSFHGYCFHIPKAATENAVKATINARFSLITVGCANGDIVVYNAKDYTGNIAPSHSIRPPPAASSKQGHLSLLSYSPDGYCLFVGYDKGWAMWSVYGKASACSFTAERDISAANSENWLLGVKEGFWLGNGSQIVLLGHHDNELWILDMARSALVSNFSSANVSRSLLQTNNGFMLYKGHESTDLATVGESGFWQSVDIPSTYLARQWPIRNAVIANDGRYVAVAGRRGLAHYSVGSGRWKTFDDLSAESDFAVRGGMCWHQHVLIAAVETSYDTYELRIYSRESSLNGGSMMHVEQLESAAVILTPTGADSLLVYTYGNILLHYIINVNNSSVKLLQVGQIALNGIVRAPPRVRALSWILPEEQLDSGDPSQDVAMATIIFLVDGKLVSLQPATKETGELKYEMRIIAQNVEYYALMRDRPTPSAMSHATVNPTTVASPSQAPDVPLYYQNDLRDSLWFFDGKDMRVWTDVQEVLASASPELARELPEAVRIPVDFYPLNCILDKGVLFGVEGEIAQRRDVSFTVMRLATRTHLFLPQILQHHIDQYNTPSALYLSHTYSQLPYFPHALEVLLHTVLDFEVDKPPIQEETALLPQVLSFLESFPCFLSVVLQCTRKTEVRSWRTLFRYLPSPRTLFERAMEEGNLVVAGGYLLVVHTLEDEEGARSSSRQVVELLGRAKEEGEWELCKELARFLRALDEDGSTLQRALEDVGLANPRKDGLALRTSRLSISGASGNPVTNGLRSAGVNVKSFGDEAIEDGEDERERDYFS